MSTKLKVEFEMNEMDLGNVFSVLIEHETAMKDRMRAFRPREDGTWETGTDAANFGWYRDHVEYLERLRKVILAGIKTD